MANEESVLIVGISPHTTEEMLKDYFERNYGKVTPTCFTPFSNFCFVDFDDPNLTHTVLMNKYHTINGNEVEAKGVVPRYWKRTLFVKGLPRTVKQEELRAFFQTLGNVTNAHIARDGIGFIAFESEAVTNVVFSKGRFDLDGTTVVVERALPTSDSDQPAGPSSANNFDGNEGDYPGVCADIGHNAGSGYGRIAYAAGDPPPPGRRIGDISSAQMGSSSGDGHNGNYGESDQGNSHTNDPGVCADIGYDPSLY